MRSPRAKRDLLRVVGFSACAVCFSACAERALGLPEAPDAAPPAEDLARPADLAAPDQADLAGPADLTVPVDLARSPDLTPRPDLAPAVFTTATFYGVPNSVSDIVVADFDANHTDDLVVTSANNGTPAIAAVLAGDGQGAFFSAIEFEMGPDPAGLASGDFDGDGRPDVVAGDYDHAQVLVALNHASVEVSSFPVGKEPFAIGVADFDGDQHLDLAVACFDNAVWILLGDGSGGFGAGRSYPTGTSLPRRLVIADFDADGALDVVVSAKSGVALLPGGPGASLGAPVALPFSAEPLGLTRGDFNGDGWPDVVVASNTTPGQIGVYLNDGKGRLAAPLEQPGGSRSVSMVNADFNSDGQLDLALLQGFTLQSTSMDSAVTILLGYGDGLFVESPALAIGTGARLRRGLATGDFDGDGRPDLVAGSIEAHGVSVFLNRTPR